jgi:predicted GTPase
MGYSGQELADLQATIDEAGVDVVIAGTPCDLGRLIETRTPIVRARYEFDDVDSPRLADIVLDFVQNRHSALHR